LEGQGALGFEYLFRSSLRMRPDRLVFGEIRGAELKIFLEAILSGHRGSMATMHAENEQALLARIEWLSPGFSAKLLAGEALYCLSLERGSPPRVRSLTRLNDLL
jgi:pilus assembly protein CpaF